LGRRSRGKNYGKPVFLRKTLDQNLTQILLGHIFKTPEKNTFSQQTRFSTDVMAQKTHFFGIITSSLRLDVMCVKRVGKKPISGFQFFQKKKVNHVFTVVTLCVWKNRQNGRRG